MVVLLPSNGPGSSGANMTPFGVICDRVSGPFCVLIGLSIFAMCDSPHFLLKIKNNYSSSISIVKGFFVRKKSMD
jgi:hypothetical protein